MIAAAMVALALAAGGVVWTSAVERWIGQELRSLAAAHLNPTFDFDVLSYIFPRTIRLRGVRFAIPDPASPTEAVEILATDSLTLVLSRIPRPNTPFRMQQLDLVRPTLRLVRIRPSGESGGLLGFSDLVKRGPESAAPPTPPPVRLSDRFQVRSVSIRGARVQYDPRDGGAASMLLDGLAAELSLQPSDTGAYGVGFSLDHHPVFQLALRGKLLVDDKRLEIETLSSALQLAREHDHYLTPALQTLLAERDVTGSLTLAATGTFDVDDADSSHLEAEIEVRDARYAAGDYELALDHVGSRISTAGGAVTIEELAIDAFGGHARLAGRFELGDDKTGVLRFEGADLQIGDLVRRADGDRAVPPFAGRLGFSGTLRGPFADIGRRAEGQGRLTLREARLGRLPVLSSIDEALDRAAEALMKRERTGHDVLSLEFSFDGDRARIGKLRMNSRWYGLRGHGDAYFDARLDLAVDGGPVQRVENELGAVGDVLGEITETLVRARVTGTLKEPRIGIEVLRKPLRP